MAKSTLTSPRTTSLKNHPKPTPQGSIPSTPQRRQENSRKIPKSTPRVRGLDEINPFLHQIGKIVSEEIQKHDETSRLKWFTTWESWISQDLLTAKSMNTITNIICPDLHYNQRTIKTVVTRCIERIPPIESYIDITHLTDKSVTWKSRVGDIDT